MFESEASSDPATTAFVAREPCVGAVVAVGPSDLRLVVGVVTATVVVTSSVDVVVETVESVVVDVVVAGDDVVVGNRGRAPLVFDPSVNTRTRSRTGLDHMSTCVALRGVRRDMVTEQ